VLFAENFESGALDEVKKRWSESSDKDGKALAFSAETPPASRGKRSLEVTATRGENTGGHLYKRLPRGVDRLYARFYVKFDPANERIHHFVTIGGHQPASNWPWPRAGERPRGDDRIYIGIEPTDLHGKAPPPGAWNFYAYWHEMKVSADGKFWGQSMSPESPILVPKDRWQCVEVIASLNSKADARDGELVLWLDGEEALSIRQGTPRGPWSGMGFKTLKEGGAPFEGFSWRTSEDLKLNFFWLLHYVTDGRYRETSRNRVWFDDIVVATERIGPIAK
jgi:hypothetical protein